MPPTTRSALLAMLVASLMMAVASVSSPAGALNSDPTQVSTSILP